MSRCVLSAKSCRKLSKQVGFTITKATYRGGNSGLTAYTGPSAEFPGYDNVVWLERRGKKVVAVEPGIIYSFMQDGKWFDAVGIVPERNDEKSDAKRS